jgi:predicted homoserine dehydrogenase-like protein
MIFLCALAFQSGETLDAIGGYTTYGQCENHAAARDENLLPQGLAEGCVLKRNIARDEAITHADVEVPPGRLCDPLREEQNRCFAAGS